MTTVTTTPIVTQPASPADHDKPNPHPVFAGLLFAIPPSLAAWAVFIVALKRLVA